MAKTVIGLFDSVAEAQNAVQAMIDLGVSRDNISMVANNPDANTGEVVGGVEMTTAESAGTGAIGGSLLGGTLGLLVGIGALAIPGIGPVLAAGPIAAAIGSTALGAGIGAATGGLLGALVGAGVPEEDASFYEEGVRRGGTLVTATVDEPLADSAAMAMRNSGAVDIDERRTTYRDSGWDSTRGAGIGGGDPNVAVDRDARPDVGSTYRQDVNDTLDDNRVYGTDTTDPAYRGDVRDDVTGAARGTSNDWEESSKVGTAGGAVAGAATGAAMGAVGGPVGMAIGGLAGAAAGAATGAAGDIVGEKIEDRADGDNYRNDMGVNDYRDTTGSGIDTTYTGTTDTTYSDNVYRGDNPEANYREGAVTGDATYAARHAENDWEESSKVGTAGGAVAGAATGAAMGAVGGPVGMAIGGLAGAAVGGAAGAAGDVAGEHIEDHADGDATRRDMGSNDYRDDTSITGGTYGGAVTPSDNYGTFDDNRTMRDDMRDVTGDSHSNDWDESSKIGTATGAAAGAATGAAMGAVGGPVGAVVGGLAGAAVGAATGAVGDVVGENVEDAADSDMNTRRYRDPNTGEYTDDYINDGTTPSEGRKGQVDPT